MRSASGEEADLDFMKSAETKEFLQGSTVKKTDRCEKKKVDGEIRGSVENTKVAKNPASGGAGGGVKEPDFEAERHPERMRKGTGGMEGGFWPYFAQSREAR